VLPLVVVFGIRSATVSRWKRMGRTPGRRSTSTTSVEARPPVVRVAFLISMGPVLMRRSTLNRSTCCLNTSESSASANMRRPVGVSGAGGVSAAGSGPMRPDRWPARSSSHSASLMRSLRGLRSASIFSYRSRFSARVRSESVTT
jgi:hypothetical protein